jgi:hypothetical protein
VRTSRTVSAGTGLTGGGDLSADRTLSADFATQAEAEAGTNTTKVMTPERTAQHVTARIATQAEAEAGTNTTKVMTPERTAQHVTARIATQAEAEAGTDTTKVMSPERTAQHVTARIATQAEAEAGINTTKVMTPERTAQHVTARIATQAEAEAGTNTTKVMTPERTAQHVAARIATQAEAEAGTNNTKLMTPLRTAQAIAALQPAPVIVGPVSTTSGTAFDVQNIPSWVRTITLNAAGISLSGTDSLLLQLGTDNAVITTGYASVSVNPNVGAGGTTNTTGFVVFMGNAGLLFHGHIRVDLAPGSVAVSSHSGSTTSAVNSGVHGGGSVAITDPITRIRLTRTGSNTFDNGSFFVRYSA